MSEPFLAEIRIVSFNFPPKGWAFCNGQILPINQNQALFSLLGTTYGGNGQTTFALPDLRGRTPVHVDNSSIQLGQRAGEENHTLTVAEMPSHLHIPKIVNADGANTPPPTPSISKSKIEQRFSTVSPGSTVMNPSSISNSGGGQAHNNMQPSLVLNYCIALQGIFPSRN
ncbi:MAG: tail fiber protein [Bacteroidota bacterium]|nr:tail fiber protein [Bacteroidota bacterium]